MTARNLRPLLDALLGAEVVASLLFSWGGEHCRGTGMLTAGTCGGEKEVHRRHRLGRVHVTVPFLRLSRGFTRGVKAV